jgi:hypothetical protein
VKSSKWIRINSSGFWQTFAKRIANVRVKARVRRAFSAYDRDHSWYGLTHTLKTCTFRHTV